MPLDYYSPSSTGVNTTRRSARHRMLKEGAWSRGRPLIRPPRDDEVESTLDVIGCGGDSKRLLPAAIHQRRLEWSSERR